NHLDSPVALVGDATLLAASPLLLETVLAVTRTTNNQAIPAADLTKKIDTVLRKPFADHLAQSLESGKLTPNIGCLCIKKKPHLFLWKDTGVAAAATEPRRAAEPVAALAQHFDE